jgi:hypothetical protein
MRKCVLVLTFIAAALSAFSCAGGPSVASREAPELLRAVPSDALSVGVFSRLDKGLERMVDSASVLRSLDFGKLSRARTAVAMCYVGSLSPLLVVEAGRCDGDTLAPVHSLLAQADSLRISAAFVALETHNALLLSPSATVVTVAGRHIASESSILDAPDFQSVLDVLGGQDAVIYRNSGAAKLFGTELCSVSRKTLNAFMHDASEWTVVSGDKVDCVQPGSGRYFCNFLESLGDGQSRLAASWPSRSELVVDLPVEDLASFRKSYEAWRDARVELEQYQKRIQELSKKRGKSPLAWEKELGIKEIAYLAAPGFRVNMIRTSKGVKDEEVVPNPYTGFVSALYGNLFNPADSCIVRRGEWLLSGERAVLDTLTLGTVKPENWPARARLVLDTDKTRIISTQQNIKVWNTAR